MIEAKTWSVLLSLPIFSSAAMVPWRCLAAHHRHCVAGGAGRSVGSTMASISFPARPAAAAVDSSAFSRAPGYPFRPYLG